MISPTLAPYDVRRTSGNIMQQAFKERRAETRNHVHMWAIVRRHGSMVREKIIIANLSRDGFKMRTTTPFAVDDAFFLELSTGLMTEVRVVRVDSARRDYGCRFLYSLPLALVQTILDRAAPPRDVAA
jgi:hypothetical protein